MRLSKGFSVRLLVVFIALFGLLPVEKAAANSSSALQIVPTLSSPQSTIGDQGTKGTGSAG
ncbi:MAG: hypothetical protein JNJ46_23835 [Myxococcales bacterium]|jgi:hypothetical protein|nr:hypothetical protein [Myxococcales bacterium]